MVSYDLFLLDVSYVQRLTGCCSCYSSPSELPTQQATYINPPLFLQVSWDDT